MYDSFRDRIYAAVFFKCSAQIMDALMGIDQDILHRFTSILSLEDTIHQELQR